MMVRYRLILLLITAGWLGALGQSALQFQEAARDALAAFDAPGFSLGVIKDGEVVLSEGFGTRTINTSQPVDGSTIYAIASNTKAFISTAITKLHEEGKLDLNAPVRDYLPYFQLYDEYVSQHTMVRDLLCHRVGLGTYSGDAIWYKTDKSAEEIIRQLPHLPQSYEWRGGYGYTNLMFITAGEVIKKVTGQEWSDYIHQHFIAAINMDRTHTTVSTLAGIDNVATPHITHRDNMPITLAPWEASGAAGGILSCTDDMLKWIDMQLQPDIAEEVGLFPKAARDQCMTPHTAISSSNFYSAGLGWFIYTREGRKIVTHGGGYDGMYSRVLMIPEMNVGIVILTNSMTGLSSRLANYIRDSYLGVSTEQWLTEATNREQDGRKKWQAKFEHIKESRKRGTTPSISKGLMVGKYYDPLYGHAEIKIDNNDITLHFDDAPALDATLTHWHYDTYKLEWHEPHAWFDFGTVQFMSDNNQKVHGLKFEVPNDDIFFEELNFVKVVDGE